MGRIIPYIVENKKMFETTNISQLGFSEILEVEGSDLD